MKRSLYLLPLLLAALPQPVRADDAATLPKGVGRVRIKPIYSFFSRRWNQDGASERLTHDFDRRDLNAEVFPDLNKLERLYDYKAGSLTLGTSNVQSNVQVVVLPIAAEFGILDRLTVGVIVPIVHLRHTLTSLSVDPEPRCTPDRCGMGKNPGDTKVSRDDSKYLPLDHDKDASTKLLAPLNTEDVQHLLGDELSYQRMESWSGTGLGDIELGFKVRVFSWRFYTTALQAGVRLPTGRTDDPNNLLDLGFGDGQTDLGFYWQNDFTPWRGLRLNVTMKYTAQLPDRELKRVPTAVNVPLAKKENMEEVWRDLGDIFELDLLAAYAVLPVLKPFVRYNFVAKGEDDVRGDKGLAYQSLMDETAVRNHRIEAGVTFTTIPWVAAKKFSIPLDATLSYERSLAGKNNAAISNVLALEIAGYFKVF
ncbi:MAG: hypothetical protein IT371_26910 [Deltaproteobacteria bacterium]|nr:hypothetical protein [Deltaproteobacteria bacterium]